MTTACSGSLMYRRNSQLLGRGAFMKKAVSKKSCQNEDMRPEYDFSAMKGAVRGKYFKAYRAGHKVEIHKADGTCSTQHFKLEDGAVMLEPDVKNTFPTRNRSTKLFVHRSLFSQQSGGLWRTLNNLWDQIHTSYFCTTKIEPNYPFKISC